MTLFNDSMPWGNFGLIARWDQTLDSAPRYRATLDFLTWPGENVTPPPAAILGDGDGNGVVDFADFLMFAAAFGKADPQWDFDGSATVDFPDFITFAGNFGAVM